MKPAKEGIVEALGRSQSDCELPVTLLESPCCYGRPASPRLPVNTEGNGGSCDVPRNASPDRMGVAASGPC